MSVIVIQFYDVSSPVEQILKIFLQKNSLGILSSTSKPTETYVYCQPGRGKKKHVFAQTTET